MKAASELPPGGTIVEPSPSTRSPLKQTPVGGEEADVVLGVAGGGERRAGRRAPRRPAGRTDLGVELVGAGGVVAVGVGEEDEADPAALARRRRGSPPGGRRRPGPGRSPRRGPTPNR